MWRSFLCLSGKNNGAVSRYEDSRDRNPVVPHNPPDQNAGTSRDRNRGNVVRFSRGELANITNNFDEDSIIGRGDFGPMYKAKFEATDQVVGVKYLFYPGRKGDEEFSMVVGMLSHLHHPNLVNLIGYCSEMSKRYLVYHFTSLGCLDEHLYDPKPPLEPLEWETRMRIALGTARGLNYLHHEVSHPILFMELTTANILLDEGFHPRLTGFGSANFSPVGDGTRCPSALIMRLGYMAPEFANTGLLSRTSDVYSFGAILVALITGSSPHALVVSAKNPLLYNWLLPKMKELDKVVDPAVGERYNKRSLRLAADLALACLDLNPDVRPTMEVVLQKLEGMRVGQASTSRGKGKVTDS